MCVYCSMGDNWFRHDPPWQPPYQDQRIPLPSAPYNPAQPEWPIDKIKAYLDLLKQVRDLEAQVGCPCEPNKADYIGLFEKRIAALEEKAKARRGEI